MWLILEQQLLNRFWKGRSNLLQTICFWSYNLSNGIFYFLFFFFSSLLSLLFFCLFSSILLLAKCHLTFSIRLSSLFLQELSNHFSVVQPFFQLLISFL